MDRDWGSRDPAFIALTAEMRERLLAVANGAPSHVCVPLQGSGTFIVEAALGTLLGPDDRLLICSNGAYGERMRKICKRLGISAGVYRKLEDEPIDPAGVYVEVSGEGGYTHVAVVHCETTTGMHNPLEEIAAVCAELETPLIVDAMSSFGILPIDLQTMPLRAVLASSNKGLEGVPGLGFALVEEKALAAAAGNSRSLALDLHEQWRGLEENGQWRFTPPVQVVAALVEALRALEAEGGQPGRYERYSQNMKRLVDGMTRLGFTLFLNAELQAPVIATFNTPRNWGVDFQTFYDRLAAAGFLIYPGKVTLADTFRIGCIGQVFPDDMRRLVDAVAAMADALPDRRAA